jgi:DNA repair protein RadA/Sms
MSRIRAVKAAKSVHVCQQCGHQETKWLGRCPACQEWNSLVEQFAEVAMPRPSSSGVAIGEGPQAITNVVEINGTRLVAGIGELDRVLGGGLVAGSAVLLGGDPGVGKSTLLIQALAGLCAAGRVLYATGEESIAQAAMRARRVGAAREAISIVAETDVEKILAHAIAARPAVLAVDSIQTVYTPALDSIPGSLAQVRECASRLVQFAKTTGTPVVIVGHVTKDGGLAGPKTLEHLVDAVLQLEGDGGPYRILRAHKNRFGSTQEIGVFEMVGAGMAEVTNPSAHLLAERPIGAPGSVAPAVAGIGRRTAAGVDSNRVALLLAVLAQRAACDVLDRDVFVNVAGGIRLVEPAIDLGIACAIASSARGRAIDARTVMFGEVGLAGEIRAVTLCEQRLAEAARLGFSRAILPAQNANRILASRASSGGAAPLNAELIDRSGLELIPVDRLASAIGYL